jgi:hypothetical protein
MSIQSKSNEVRGAKDLSVFRTATVETTTARGATETTGPCPSISAGQRIEQMYQLADIFASIFEVLPDEHKQAIARNCEAA